MKRSNTSSEVAVFNGNEKTEATRAGGRQAGGQRQGKPSASARFTLKQSLTAHLARWHTSRSMNIRDPTDSALRRAVTVCLRSL